MSALRFWRVQVHEIEYKTLGNPVGKGPVIELEVIVYL